MAITSFIQILNPDTLINGSKYRIIQQSIFYPYYYIDNHEYCGDDDNKLKEPLFYVVISLASDDILCHKSTTKYDIKI